MEMNQYNKKPINLIINSSVISQVISQVQVELQAELLVVRCLNKQLI